MVLRSTRAAIQGHQSRGVALASGMLSDLLLGKLELKIGGAEAAVRLQRGGLEEGALRRLGIGRRGALGRLKPQMREREVGGFPPPCRALQEALLDEVGLIDVLQRIRLLPDHDRDGGKAHWTAR